MPRDFVDVYVVTRSRSPQDILKLASELDPGLDAAVLTLAMRRLASYRDQDIPLEAAQIAGLRRFFDAWADTLNR